MTFNQLTAAEAERLAILAEECGEVVQVIGKILRHGYNSHHPDGSPTNRSLLEKELGDIDFIRNQMTAYEDVDGHEIQIASDAKREKIGKWLHVTNVL